MSGSAFVYVAYIRATPQTVWSALKFIEAVSGGWPKVISNLKSLLETGSAVLQDPYPN
jgi:hypothetical protein